MKKEQCQKPFIFEDGDVMAGITKSMIKPFVIHSEAKDVTENNQDVQKRESDGIMKVEISDTGMIRPMQQFDEEDDLLIRKINHTLGISPCDNKAFLGTAEMVAKLKAEGRIHKISNNSIKANKLNFELKLLKIIKNIKDMPNGEEEGDVSYSVEVTVTQRNGNKNKFCGNVQSDKIKDFAWLKRLTHSQATIPSDKEERREFMNIVQEAIERTGIPVEILYPCSGWRKISGESYGYVIHQGVIGTNLKLIHTDSRYHLDYEVDKIGKKETFNKAINMSNICRNKCASSEIFLFFHASLMTKLFELSGHPIKFIFGLIGLTNSRKTSMVVAMAKLFNRDKLIADTEFTSTSCGIEKKLGLYGDSPLIVDDFKPGATQAKQKAIEDKLEQLVRFYGDRVEKSRMTDFMSNGKNVFFPIKGTCIMTGELISGVESSLSRMFLVEIDQDDVDNDLLTFYQKNITILPSHTYDFIVWISQNFETIKNYVSERFDFLRREINFLFPRFCEMYAVMQITAEIIRLYGVQRCFWSEPDGDKFMTEMREIVIGEIRDMEQRISDRDTSKLVLFALDETTRKGIISPLILNKENLPRKAEIYENDEMYFVRAESMVEILKNYCKRHCEVLPQINTHTIINWFTKHGVLEWNITKGGKRENVRKLPRQEGNGCRYLYINKEKLKKKMEEIG